MADLGADVIKVEAAGGDPIRGLMRQAKSPGDGPTPDLPFEFLNRGKRSIELDLNHDDGVAVAHRLATWADVVIVNLLPERRQRFRIDVDDLHGVKPDLVIGLLSGYGQQGVDIDRPGYDVTAFFARSGILAGLTTPEGAPPRTIFGQGDHTTALSLFGGVMAALIARDKTGEGQVVETSLVRTAAFTLGFDLSTAAADGRPNPSRPRHRALSAMLEAFKCSDDHWIQLAMPDRSDAWPRFCTAFEREDLAGDERFLTGRTRYRNMADLIVTLDETIGSKPSTYWAARLDSHDCIWGPVNDAATAAKDPQLRAAGVFDEIDDPITGKFEIVAAPFGLVNQPEVGAQGRAPLVGEHTQAILTEELGFSDAEAAELSANGIV